MLPHTFADPVVCNALAGVPELAGWVRLAYEPARVTEGVCVYTAPSLLCYHPEFCFVPSLIWHHPEYLLPLWFHARATPSWPARLLPHTSADPVVYDAVAGVLELAGMLCLALDLARVTEGALAFLAAGSVQGSPLQADPRRIRVCPPCPAQVPSPCFVASVLPLFQRRSPVQCWMATSSWSVHPLHGVFAGPVVVVVVSLVLVYGPAVYVCLVYDPAHV